MNKITDKIQDCGIVFGCGDYQQKTSSIMQKEAEQILALVKSEIIMAINNVGLSADDNAAVINAIKEVGE